MNTDKEEELKGEKQDRKKDKVKKESKLHAKIQKFKQTEFAKYVSKIWNNAFFRVFWVRIGILAILINFIVEAFNRLSFGKALAHMFVHPVVFLYNTLMVYATLSIASLFRKRVFAVTIVSLTWIGIGCANLVISATRVTPFTAQDFRNIKDGLDIMDKYLSKVGMIVVGSILAVVLIIAIVFLIRKSPTYKGKRHFARNLIVTLACFGGVIGFTAIGNATGLLAKNFGNLRNAYRYYGFGYCFSQSLLNTGIKKPKNYSKEKVDELINNEEESTPVVEPEKPLEKPKDTPNIIYVQLESLFDPTLLKGLEFSEDPIPNLHKLYKNYSSGYFSVPAFGAGTANTEFETMTGMNLDDFGPGEYPYKTILQKTACESVGYDLKKYGYKINALHNNKGNFYQRNTVFAKLGYDTFTSLEYIENFEQTPLEWAKDYCLTGEIVDILQSSKEKDFIYTISVQGHGSYPEDTSMYNLPIKVTGNNVTGNPNGFEYYVNQIHEMDEFVGQLVDTLSTFDEHTIVVFYGDHLPTYDIEDSDLINGDVMQTNYVIWDNFGMEKIDMDMQAYELSSIIFERLGMTGGVINEFHKERRNDEDQEAYLADLKILEYDILYGEKEAYNGELPYEITDIKMGHKEIRIDSVQVTNGNTVVRGQNFTWASVVLINSEQYETSFISSNVLLLKGIKASAQDEFIVEQRTSGGSTLSSTDTYIYEPHPYQNKPLSKDDNQ
ncbi:MAG: sulfatase-like hydrolase/transferase [Butyrivibrio sp.]|nr:sulfatase-like hydrolase/transferase [Butyrivibrio sp.]